MAKSGRTPRRVPAPRPRRRALRLPASPPPAPRTFTLGAVPGATPGTWISRWREREPGVALILESITVDRQRDELLDGVIDVALVRLPLDPTDLHVIALYDEVIVAVVPVDSALTAVDELTLDDLAGEVVIAPRDDVLGLTVEGAVAPRFAPPTDTSEAIAMAAAGVGVVLVPMSLARLHARRDVAMRPVKDASPSTIALAWPRDATTADVETFVGIVRGRTANSSR